MTTKTRKVKSCDNCQYWCGFPYVHCLLDCKIINKTVSEHTFKTFPKNFEDCKNKRFYKKLETQNGFIIKEEKK